MRGSLAFGLVGLTLVAACAFGTEDPTHRLRGDNSSGTSGNDDSGSVGTTTPPGSGTNPSPGAGASSDDGGGGGYHGGGGGGGGGGGSSYEGGSSYYEGGYGYEGGSYSESGSGGGGGSTTCMGYAPPTVSASCTACSKSPCQANGCYGGYWCDMSTSKCHSTPPSGC